MAVKYYIWYWAAHELYVSFVYSAKIQGGPKMAP